MFAEIINLKIKNMLIYNTTFQVDDEVHDNFFDLDQRELYS